MDVHPNYLAIIVAAVANYAIAFLWYAVIFAKTWQRLSGVSDMTPTATKIILTLIGSFLMSYVLYHSIAFGDYYVRMSGAGGGLMGGFFSWLGFVFPVTLMTKLYEKKPWGLWLLDNGFWLVSLLVMGVILSFWI